MARSTPGKTYRWTFGGRPYSIYYNKQGGLRILNFTSSTILSKLSALQRNLHPKIINIKDLHISLGYLERRYRKTYKEDEIINEIKAAQDWKLIISRKNPNGSVDWIYERDMYD